MDRFLASTLFFRLAFLRVAAFLVTVCSLGAQIGSTYTTYSYSADGNTLYTTTVLQSSMGSSSCNHSYTDIIALTGPNGIHGLNDGTWNASQYAGAPFSETINDQISSVVQGTYLLSTSASVFCSCVSRAFFVSNPPPQSIPPPPPKISGISPAAGVTGTSNYIQIYGTKLSNGVLPTVSVDGNGVRVTPGNWNSDSQVNVNVAIDAGAAIGTHHLTLTNPGGSSTATYSVVAPQAFNINYQAFINFDHVSGFNSCFYLPYTITYMYNGNTGIIGGYKTLESISVTPDTSMSSGFYQDTGSTYQFAYGSPKNGSTISQSDLDNVYHDCLLFNDVQKAIPQFSVTVTYPFAHQAQVLFTGQSSDPLEPAAGWIQWNMRTTLDTTDPLNPTAYVDYNHTCFPAHEVVVNNTVVYKFMPTNNSISNLAYCLGSSLTAPMGKIISSTPKVPIPHI